MTETVKQRLLALADSGYRQFSAALLPGVTNIMGVRLPALRALAKELSRGDWGDYLKNGGEETYEEKMLKGFVIGYAEMPLFERFSRLDVFVPKIDSWGLCDSCCMTYKFMRGERERSWDYLEKHLAGGGEFQIRFAVVSMLAHFVDGEYIDGVLKACAAVRHDGYYAKMAVAWAVSACAVKFPEKTVEFLKNGLMDDFTHNKAIQKSCESFRVDKALKNELRRMKRA